MTLLDRLRQLFSPGSDDCAPAASPEPSAPRSSADWLVVGLGNPGARYAATRHNVGFLALDRLIEKAAPLSPQGLRGVPAQVWEDCWEDAGRVLLARPTTFMNNSGQAVAALAGRYAVPAERIVVIHDELDLPLGSLRLRRGGSENGHNGLKSITEELGTAEYLRVRVGIGRPEQGTSVVDHVLGALPEGPLTEETCVGAAEAALFVATRGLSRAQNAVHGRRR